MRNKANLERTQMEANALQSKRLGRFCAEGRSCETNPICPAIRAQRTDNRPPSPCPLERQRPADCAKRTQFWSVRAQRLCVQTKPISPVRMGRGAGPRARSGAPAAMNCAKQSQFRGERRERQVLSGKGVKSDRPSRGRRRNKANLQRVSSVKFQVGEAGIKPSHFTLPPVQTKPISPAGGLLERRLVIAPNEANSRAGIPAEAWQRGWRKQLMHGPGVVEWSRARRVGVWIR